MDTLEFVATYVSALESFNRDHFDFKGEGATPAVWYTEVSYTTDVANRKTVFAVGYQGTRECLMLELPVTRYLATANESSISLQQSPLFQLNH